MQIYKGKQYMERDLHVIGERGVQDVLRIMDEDFEILYDDDVIDFPDDLPEIEEIHQGENGQTTPTMNTSPIFENDPNGGVIVTDIFGGEHHYMNMEQAQTLTDL